MILRAEDKALGGEEGQGEVSLWGYRGRWASRDGKTWAR